MPIDIGSYSSMFNFATSNKWVAVIPFMAIEPELASEKVAFNLVDFTIPEINLTSNSIDLHAYSYEIPGAKIDMQRDITFNYILSSNWYQYVLLYKWFFKVMNHDKTLNNVTSAAGISDDIIANTTVSVYPLSEFLNPILEFRFVGCWIKKFGSLSMEYQGNADIVKHSFTLTFLNWGVYEPDTGIELVDLNIKDLIEKNKQLK